MPGTPQPTEREARPPPASSGRWVSSRVALSGEGIQQQARVGRGLSSATPVDSDFALNGQRLLAGIGRPWGGGWVSARLLAPRQPSPHLSGSPRRRARPESFQTGQLRLKEAACFS